MSWLITVIGMIIAGLFVWYCIGLIIWIIVGKSLGRLSEQWVLSGVTIIAWFGPLSWLMAVVDQEE